MDEWGVSFKLYGQFETAMDDVTFSEYHMFHGEARILSGDSSMLNEKNPFPDSAPIALPAASSANP
jgi:hypothetical protein